ncbi:hypothetical protein [Tenacibaculum sp. IB213877]|jgi:chromate transport protein ChrA|uniref:hypothetical protein n=1 Tax=Tenacibaculum sp. IB213877 TaxID=3097351 RepID=UPI002A5A8612|nr:hypothetical protein [Tenacibaculum sp. IB213877]MDY0780933.1 hypothetical protein [Tenacibaculum sp. IB213877]
MKESKLGKFLPLIVAIIAIIGAILFFRVMMQSEETIKTDAAVQASVVNPLVTFSLVLLGATAIIAVFASIVGVFKNPAALKKTLLGLLGLGVVLLASYLFSNSGEVVDANQEVIAVAGSKVSKLTSTGIWVSLILLVVGGFFFVVDLVKGLIK